MKLLSTIILGTTLVASQAMGSGCSEMAAFNTRINEFLKTASISESQRSDIQLLAGKCKTLHNKGAAVSDILPCNTALEMTRIN